MSPPALGPPPGTSNTPEARRNRVAMVGVSLMMGMADSVWTGTPRVHTGRQHGLSWRRRRLGADQVHASLLCLLRKPINPPSHTFLPCTMHHAPCPLVIMLRICSGCVHLPTKRWQQCGGWLRGSCVWHDHVDIGLASWYV